MKQKDYLLIVVIAIFSTVMSILFSNMFLSSEADRSQSVEVVDVITTEFIAPPEKFFNASSVNPTRIIRISPVTSGNPFGQ